ncbi:uncharacterized protein LOC128330242 isoform X2 [Hemicordylus capensis]|uniref:uncharacterized protein LOC128330242 isoform X2 n=1 Tax=Hemicordylus capensis TaxID=884348 RepID=UPI002302DCD2|nr:uncharacterized protein LOC128330242 isoform X2 [Hemicordylus capensis]
MAAEDGDSGTLKRNVLHLLLQHPQGVRFSDFSGAFYQFHGYHPKLALHGYRSLKNLVSDMKDFVILENNSLEPVIKIANGSYLYHWLEGGEENGLDSSEGETQSLTDEEQAGEEADLSVALVPIQDVLQHHPQGLKLKKLKEVLKEKHQFDLERFCSDLGYKDTVSCLQDIPDLLLLNSSRTKNCVVLLQSGPSSPAPSLDTDFSANNSNTTAQELMGNKSGTSSPTPSLDTDFFACNSHAVPQRLVEKKSDLAAALVPILAVLEGQPLGLNLQELKENLGKHGFDLETFSQNLGYKDMVCCLMDMPGLHFSFKNGKWPYNCVIQLLSCSSVLPPWLLNAGPSLDKPSSSRASNILPQELMETKPGLPASHSSTSSQIRASVSLDSKCSARKSKASNKKPALSEVLELLTNLIGAYQSGLKVKKVQELLLAKDGVDLEKFSIAQGHKDSLAFLEHQMPELNIKNHEDRLNCVVKHGSGPGNNSVPPLSDASVPRIQTKRVEPSVSLPVSEVLALLTNLIGAYQTGLKVKKVQELLLAKDGVDLEKFSTAQGHQDSLAFLEHQMPELNIRYQEHRPNCVVQLGSGPEINSVPPLPNARIPSIWTNIKAEPETSVPALSKVLALLTNLIGAYQLGLKVKKVQELLLAKDGVDLEKFSIAQGHQDSLAFLEHQMPELNIRYQENRLNCVVQLGSGPGINFVPPLPNARIPSVWTNIKAEPATSVPVVSEVLALLTNLIGAYQSGLKVKKVQELLLARDGVDLEKFSIAQGHQDSLAFLEHQMPELNIRYQEDRLNCVVQLGPALSEVLALLTDLVAKYRFGLKVKKVQELLLAKDGVDLERFSIAQGHQDLLAFLEHQMPELNIRYQEDRLNCVVQLAPALSEVLALLTNLIGAYQSGLKVKKVQELLLAKDGVDLERLSIAQGHQDSLAFLEHQMPELNIRYQEERHNCVVQLGSGPGVNSGSSLVDVAVPIIQMTRVAEPQLSHRNNVPASKAWTKSLPVPSTTIPNCPSSWELSGTSGKTKNSSPLHSDVSSQLASVCQFGGSPPAKEINYMFKAQLPSSSNLTDPHSLKDLDELKQKVAHILGMHPEGMSLFQFRAAYNATYQEHLPLGNASSAKHRLLEMPDVVCLKGYGVQTLLQLVSTKETPVKSAQRISSRVENAAVVPGHSAPVAESVVVFQPSVPKAPEMPQPRLVNPLASVEPDKESCAFPEGWPLGASKPVALLQEHRKTGTNLGDLSGLSDFSKVQENTLVPGRHLSKADPVVVPTSCLKTSLPKAAVAPEPQHRSSVLLYSECLKGPSKKESHPLPESSSQRAPQTVAPVQRQVTTGVQPRETPLTPSSPVVFSSDSRATRWGENFVSKPTHLANPWVSSNSTAAPSFSQPGPANFTAWGQPVVYPPITFLSHSLEYPPLSLLPFPPVSIKAPRIQPHQLESRSSHLIKAVPEMRPAQPVSPIRNIEQRSHVPIATGLSSFSQAQIPSRIQRRPYIPVSLPSQDSSSIQPSKSQTIHKQEYYHHPWLDGPQCNSVPTVDNSITAMPSATAPTNPPASMPQRQYVRVNSVVTSPSTPSSSSQPAPTSWQPSSASSSTSTKANPQAFQHQQQNSVSPTVTSPIRPARSVTHLHFPTEVSNQPNASYSASMDYGAPNQTKPPLPISKEAGKQDNHNHQLPGNQNLTFTQGSTNPFHSPPLQNRPSPKSHDKCVIL